MTTQIDPERSLAELVQENPQRARIFEERDLDFCCGGRQSLEDACSENDIDLDELRDSLASVDDELDPEETREFHSLTDLVDFIVDNHHAYLKDELGSLGRLVDKVARVHGDNHPELREVQEEYDALAGELPVHLSEEEQILFPAVRHLEGHGISSNEGKAAREVLSGLEADHDETAEHLERIHDLTSGYQVPDDACPSYRNMLARLEDLEQDIHMHVHRENNVLFPKVRERLA